MGMIVVGTLELREAREIAMLVRACTSSLTDRRLQSFRSRTIISTLGKE
jgi:hypothetical protein